MTWAQTYRQTLTDVLGQGHPVDAGASLSVGSSRSSWELLNHSYTIHDPVDRIIRMEAARFNLAAAIGRFVWMVKGSNRLDEIVFYDPRAARFSDDGFTVPGSSDGFRLFNPRPGLNQIDNIVNVLRSEPTSRRAVAVVYHPEDAGRVSRDVPCHIGVSYNLREGALHATTMMRSCNAARVLPYDFFLFSLLAELVARSVGCPLGTYHQFTVSMHVYSQDEAHARRVVAAPPGLLGEPMPEMPGDDITRRLHALADAERDLRLRAPHLSLKKLQQWLQELADQLGPYWAPFAQVLLLHAAQSGGLATEEVEELATAVRLAVFGAFRPLV